ncbi:hypothetical protein [Aliivibrio logei]|uniref:Restriction endonuclease n=1 Tax=Aliivibrio logei 5S-186 TaxID=626086 RepID=A0ABX3AXQ6_ALILO|nr:hypothetical protein [Aliivibrio logei]OEF18987.1 hypothetical protein A1Q5_18545 [Aliivibrio logei 5S-186]
MTTKIVERIESHLNSIDFDLRKSGNARFIDQKCTPDILSSVAEAILELTEDNEQLTFTVKDVWSSPFANDVMIDRFQKPAVTHPGAQNEYDKVFSQPIKLLEYAQLLIKSGKKGTAVTYKVNNAELLRHISINDNKSLNFLISYLLKVLNDSGLTPRFDSFFEKQNKQSFNDLKDGYCAYIIKHTPINGDTEVRRIFTKIINPLAFKKKALGTKGGRLSPMPISYAELFYNRVNFRDITKPKGEPRKLFLESLGDESSSESYQVEKAKRQIKKYHEQKSETHRFQHESANHAHHIFMKSEFPELSDTFENLILLTPTQHLNFAHPEGNTQRVSVPYQLVCLLSKLDSIEESEFWADDFYDLSKFKQVVNTGLDKEILTAGMTFQDVKNQLACEFINRN